MLTDLGALPGGDSSVTIYINENGEIVSLSQNGLIDPMKGTPENVAVLWTNGKIKTRPRVPLRLFQTISEDCLSLSPEFSCVSSVRANRTVINSASGARRRSAKLTLRVIRSYYVEPGGLWRRLRAPLTDDGQRTTDH